MTRTRPVLSAPTARAQRAQLSQHGRAGPEGQVNNEAIGDDVLPVIDDTQILMPRHLAAVVGLALVQVASSKQSVLDGLPADLSRPCAGSG